jgi:hypothetical protein
VSGAVAELLARCQAAGLSLTAEGEALHVDYFDAPPAELVEELRRQKPALLAILGEAAAPAEPPWSETEEERAAIVEYDGRIPRAWAEGFARLDPARPPAYVPPRRWEQFIDDVGRFLDSPLRALAGSEGWGPFDLFACDRDRPFARIDRAGLLWLLNGDKLVELTETTATIETRTGQRQRWRRKPDLPGRVLAWELVP